MSVRQDQDALLIVIEDVASSHVRQQQESILIMTKQVPGTVSHVRQQQECIIMLVPPSSCKRTQLINGNFQDTEGNPLAAGFITLGLSEDAQSCFGQVASGIRVKIPLDANGNISGTSSGPTYFVWGNDMLTPAGTKYVIRSYSSIGQQVWGPWSFTITTGSGTFDCNSFVPGTPGS